MKADLSNSLTRRIRMSCVSRKSETMTQGLLNGRPKTWTIGDLCLMFCAPSQSYISPVCFTWPIICGMSPRSDAAASAL